MNEQVKQLMIKHGLHKYISEDCQSRMEMLAELLEKEYFSEGYLAGKSDGVMETVRECLDIVEDEDDGSQDTIAIRWAMHRIRKHYGITE